MANFIKQNKRIPRRGEIGRSADEIQHFENLGYVMSGSRYDNLKLLPIFELTIFRNKKMTAVRIRKESQVYSAEERRILDEMKGQEREKRENELIANLRQMVDSKSKTSH